jgi:hypothetical protein
MAQSRSLDSKIENRKYKRGFIEVALTDKKNINSYYVNSNELIICATLLTVWLVLYYLKSQSVRSEPSRLLRTGPLEPCPAAFNQGVPHQPWKEAAGWYKPDNLSKKRAHATEGSPKAQTDRTADSPTGQTVGVHTRSRILQEEQRGGSERKESSRKGSDVRERQRHGDDRGQRCYPKQGMERGLAPKGWTPGSASKTAFEVSRPPYAPPVAGRQD